MTGYFGTFKEFQDKFGEEDALQPWVEARGVDHAVAGHVAAHLLRQKLPDPKDYEEAKRLIEARIEEEDSNERGGSNEHVVRAVDVDDQEMSDVEQDSNEDVEQDSNEDVEQDSNEDVEQGSIEDVEQGSNEGVEQGSNEGVEHYVRLNAEAPYRCTAPGALNKKLSKKLEKSWMLKFKSKFFDQNPDLALGFANLVLELTANALLLAAGEYPTSNK